MWLRLSQTIGGLVLHSKSLWPPAVQLLPLQQQPSYAAPLGSIGFAPVGAEKETVGLAWPRHISIVVVGVAFRELFFG